MIYSSYKERRQLINSQAPDVPEMAHLGIVQLSRLSVNCFFKTEKKYPLYLNRTDFMKILPVPGSLVEGSD